MTFGSVQRATQRLKLHPHRVILPIGCVTFGSLCTIMDNADKSR
jgi:uncharacterized membrane protein